MFRGLRSLSVLAGWMGSGAIIVAVTSCVLPPVTAGLDPSPVATTPEDKSTPTQTRDTETAEQNVDASMPPVAATGFSSKAAGGTGGDPAGNAMGAGGVGTEAEHDAGTGVPAISSGAAAAGAGGASEPPVGVPQLCRACRKLGEACTVDGECMTGSCLVECRERGALGAPCDTRDDCQASFVCHDHSCEAYTGTRCETDNDCASDSCLDSKCQDPSRAGGRCDSSPDCERGTVCVNDLCKAENGTTCHSSAECASGNCDSMTCR